METDFPQRNQLWNVFRWVINQIAAPAQMIFIPPRSMKSNSFSSAYFCWSLLWEKGISLYFMFIYLSIWKFSHVIHVWFTSLGFFPSLWWSERRLCHGQGLCCGQSEACTHFTQGKTTHTWSRVQASNTIWSRWLLVREYYAHLYGENTQCTRQNSSGCLVLLKTRRVNRYFLHGTIFVQTANCLRRTEASFNSYSIDLTKFRFPTVITCPD